jgi:hypothetical protein
MSIGKSFPLLAILIMAFIWQGLMLIMRIAAQLLFELTPGVADDIFHFILKWIGVSRPGSPR